MLSGDAVLGVEEADLAMEKKSTLRGAEDDVPDEYLDKD
jgi:hypothetical protein